MDVIDIFRSINLDTIEKYVANKKDENLNLEFKLISKPDLSIKVDKKNYAIALSGFSNSSGGILIFGILARKDKEGIDCASELKPIEGIASLLSRLNELTGEFVKPINDGVQHKKVFSDESNDEGFVVTYIPESSGGPHMAKAGEDRYYKRSGDSFYKMEHFDIEDMFGRRKTPKLELFIKLRRGGSSARKKNVNFIFYIKNTGRGLAKYPFLEIELNTPYQFSPYDFSETHPLGLRVQRKYDRALNQISLYGREGDVIHPDCELQVIQLTHSYNLNEQIPKLVVKYKMTAEGIKDQSGEKVINDKEINEYLK